MSKYKFFRKNWFSCRRVGEFGPLSSNFGCVAAAVQRLFSAVGINAGFGRGNSELSGNFAVVGGHWREYPHLRAPDSADFGRKIAGGSSAEEDFMLLGLESRQNPDWEAILAEPLFFEDVSRGYRLNVEHASVVREYLGKLASSSQQKLLEPLTIAWDVRSDIYR